MDFVEMSKAMCDQWKQVDRATKNIFQELVEESFTLHCKHCLEAKQEERLKSLHCKVRDLKCKLLKKVLLTSSQFKR
jgi:hypothetical protein